MDKDPASPLALAICEVVVAHSVPKLLEIVNLLNPIGRERRTNKMPAGLRRVESLGAEEFVALQKLVGHKVGDQLAAAAHVSREARATPLGEPGDAPPTSFSMKADRDAAVLEEVCYP